MQSRARHARAFLACTLVGLCVVVAGAQADPAPAEKPARGKAILEAAARLDKSAITMSETSRPRCERD